MHRRLAVRGLVQGVGFRPWVWQQATALGLIGWVRNTSFGVEIDMHGDAPLLDALQARLWQAPPPARVEQVDVLAAVAAEAPPAHKPFEIQASVNSPHPHMATIGADLGVCARCLAELFNPDNRRWRHPFINCPQCGPRYTVTRSLPFDRGHTSLARFLPCAACDAEYQHGADRRFHHQTNTCPACGPRLWLKRTDGSVDEQDPIAAGLELLSEGGILAVKGLGGFHLVCDARQPEAVSRLRQRKRRDGKPLAVMMASPASIPPWASMTPHEQRWLQSAERPIVLLSQSDRARRELPGIAPDLAWLGVMLPYTPLHFLLFHEAAGRPTGTDWLTRPHEMVLVVTSGNASGSPLVIDNETAQLELAELADGWLLHDRDILARNDDSVLRVRPDGSACFIRRSRGYAPMPVALPTMPGHDRQELEPPPSVLAMGALLKNTLCITQGDRAMVSPHIGDLDSVDTRVVFTRMADIWPGWLRTQPDALACDLHPDFFSTILAAHMAHTRASTASGMHALPLIQVQHHHAHVAAVLAEHADDKATHTPVIGLALDGHGLGNDGMVWGGELLRVHEDECERLGHLWPLVMPGGDAAVREPWRMAASALHALGRTQQIAVRFASIQQSGLLQQWLQQSEAPATGKPSPVLHGHVRTTSLGRLFDAAAGLLHVLAPFTQSRFEAEAAMRLESLASTRWPAQALEHGWLISDDLVLDWRPLMNWLADQTDAAHAAAVFHATLASAMAEWAARACERHGVGTVVLSGGCLANRLLDDALHEGLTRRGLKVWRPAQYPCGDGGLSLGQAWVARQRLIRQDPCASPYQPA
ncbi:MAG: carbamoyltransferase HypF [Aquabacterium sp.]|nr:carbamoyltransferase HypF [Aquabacterium sp.]